MLFKKSVQPPAPPSDEEMKAAYLSMDPGDLLVLGLALRNQLKIIEEVIGSKEEDLL